MGEVLGIENDPKTNAYSNVVDFIEKVSSISYENVEFFVAYNIK